MKYRDINKKIDGSIVKDELAIRNSVFNVLNTPIGTTPGNPKFGCDLVTYLFGNINPLIITIMEKNIKQSLILWEPRIKVKSITINNDEDYNRLNIKLTYEIKSEVNNPEREFIYSISK